VTISVVVPARDEAERIGPLLAALSTAALSNAGRTGPVIEVIVVDDESSDDTAAIAVDAGARVVYGSAPPHGWTGKAWALQQGVEAASGDWIVTLDSDTRPSPCLPAELVARALDDRLSFVTVGGRFECPTRGAQWLHAAMLTTLVYRFGPAGRVGPIRADRHLANGQCMAFPRQAFLDAGGMRPVAAHVVEDVALARHLAAEGWAVAMLDGPDLLTTRMYDDLISTWRGWGRSLALPGVEPRGRQLIDVGIVLCAQVLPLPRLLARRGDFLDVALLLARLGTLVGTAQAYERPGVGYWLSPTADVPAVAALLDGIIRPRRSWRGRSYD
jgi:dolichol-phosphate mannosyltransferase